MTWSEGLKPELRLYTRTVAWAGKQHADDSTIQLVRWMVDHLTDPDDGGGSEAIRKRLLQLIRFRSPLQAEAEKSVRAVLNGDLTISTTKWTVREEPDRGVDWSRTYENAVTERPHRYHCRERESRPDTELRSALVYEAERWLDILESEKGTPDGSSGAVKKERVEKLRRTVREVRGKYELHPRPLNQAKISRLSNSGQAGRRAASALNRLGAHRYGHADLEELETQLRNAFESTEEGISSDTIEPSLNNAFEFSALGRIAETIEEHPRWELQALDPAPPLEAKFFHDEAALGLTVGKAFSALEDEEVRYEDTFVEMQEPAGMAEDRDPQGGKPDIRLTFFDRDDTTRNVTVLGDAKRNAETEKKGTRYFQHGVRTAAYYLAAFSDALDARIEKGEIEAPIRPCFTLFFRQGVEIPDATRKKFEAGNCSDLPVLLAFKLEHLTPDDESGLLKRWFQLISRQGLEYLS